MGRSAREAGRRDVCLVVRAEGVRDAQEQPARGSGAGAHPRRVAVGFSVVRCVDSPGPARQGSWRRGWSHVADGMGGDAWAGGSIPSEAPHHAGWVSLTVCLSKALSRSPVCASAQTHGFNNQAPCVPRTVKRDPGLAVRRGSGADYAQQPCRTESGGVLSRCPRTFRAVVMQAQHNCRQEDSARSVSRMAGVRPRFSRQGRSLPSSFSTTLRRRVTLRGSPQCH
jgi:hypothetical protein